jgi:pyridoxamine 5'-phosphate oxidase
MPTSPDLAAVPRELLEAEVSQDPFEQFDRWFRQAEAAEPTLANAMTLATVTPAGHPDARIVLLKEVDRGGFVFFTNYDSRKGDELRYLPRAALVFHWKSLERQVRIEGRIELTSAQYSDAYFATRPVGSRHSAHASPQSTVVPNRDWLKTRMKASEDKHGDDVSRPPNWGGYRLTPERIEFWQGRDDRLHDRLLYRRDAAKGWVIERLAP